MSKSGNIRSMMSVFLSLIIIRTLFLSKTLKWRKKSLNLFSDFKFDTEKLSSISSFLVFLNTMSVLIEVSSSYPLMMRLDP